MSEQKAKADAAEQPAPTIGRIVHIEFASLDQAPGGSLLCPAIITGVRDKALINVRVLSDGPGDLLWLGAVERKDIVEARAAEFRRIGAKHTPPRAVWFWPPRV